jgi:hypothetical protein
MRPGTGGTTPGSIPTPGTHRPDHPSTVVAGPSAGPHVTSDTPGTSVTSPGDTGSKANSHATSTTRPASGKTKQSASGGPASLQEANLGILKPAGDDGSLGWLAALLLLALVIAAAGAPFLIWRARRAREAAVAEGEGA